MNDSERIDRYIDALLADPNAPPPPNLPSETAALVRALVNTERAVLPPDVSDVQARVWLRALAAAHASQASNGRRDTFAPVPSSEAENKKTRPLEVINMNHSQTLARHPRTRLPSITVLAALIAVVLFGALLLAMSASKGPDDGGIIPAAGAGGATATVLPGAQFEEMFANATPLVLDEMVTGTLSAEESMQTYTFNAEETLVVRIHLESDDMDTLELSVGAMYTGLGGGGGGIGTSPAIQFQFLALQPGASALIAVSSQDGQPHTFTLHVEVINPTRVVYGEPAQSELTGDAAYRLYALEGTAGDLIAAGVESDAVNTRLSLLNQTGTTMMTDDDSGAGYNPEILDYQLYMDTTYYLLVEPSEASQSGTFTLSVEKTDHQPLPTPSPFPSMDNDHVPIELGDTVSGILSIEEPIISYELAIEEPVTLAVFAYAEDFLPGLNYMVMAENGISSGGGGGSGLMSDYTSVVRVYDVSSPSTVVITVYVDNGTPSDLTLSVQPTGAFPVIEYGETVGIELAPFTLLAFEAEAGDRVNIDLDGGGLDTYARLLNPSGGVWTEDDDNGAGLNPEMHDVRLFETGTHYIQVQAKDEEAGGTVTLSLSLSEAPAASLTPMPAGGGGGGGGGGPISTATPTQ
jgi:hypothetical protein